MKFHGRIGFWLGDVETEPGVWKPNIVEKSYVGDILRNYRKFQPVSDKVNDDLTINNQFSILSDLYLRENLSSIRYVLWNGARWKINTVEINYPRIILEIGGVYNGKTPEQIT